MLTQRATLLGFIAFCFYLIAVVNTLPGFFYVLMWLALGLLAASLGIAFVSLSGLDFDWSLARSSGHAAPGKILNSAQANERELTVPVIEATLSNRGSLNKTGILIELNLRDQAREIDISLVYLLEAVPAGKTLEIALPLRELARGSYQLRGARLVGSDVLGLFRARRQLALPATNAEIIVAPALLPAVPFALSGRGGRARRGSSRRAQLGGGDELRGTRPYIQGDDMRQIHWKSTARTGELVMREWEQVGHAASLVVWDGAAHSVWGAQGLDSCECGLIVVASLLATFAENSMPCGLAVLGQNARFCPAPASAGAAHNALGHDETLVLALARAARTGPLGAALNSVWSGERGIETLTLVSASLRSDAIDLVRSLRAQNIGTRVLLINGAALGRATGDRRFSSRHAAQNAPLQIAENGAPADRSDRRGFRASTRIADAGGRARRAFRAAKRRRNLARLAESAGRTARLKIIFHIFRNYRDCFFAWGQNKFWPYAKKQSQ